MTENGTKEKEQVGDIIVHKGEQVYEYIPYGSDAKIQLTIRLIQDYIAVPTKSGTRPTKADCFHFAMLCKARALNPWEGDCFMVGYDTKQGPKFSLITAHQAFLKRAELHPDYNGMESGVIVRDAEGIVRELPGDLVLPDQTLLGGWAKVHSKDKAIPTYRRLDVAKFKPSYPNNFWDNNPAGQIVKCAEADGLRSSYPTMLGGLYLREEMANIERGEATAVLPPAGEVRIDFDEKAVPEADKTKTETLAEKLKGGGQSTEDIHKVLDELEEKPEAKPEQKPEKSNKATDPKLSL